ncbi:MAG TPA: hypothetical protein DCK76_07855 [Desulfotomaculum sp.]|nr:MAG: Uncharacterized protein XD84_1078 [Desulfotomaculum sp. 46_80]HAG11282.1 hypothetical protein [Desulfotomaculum sp.]
MIMPFSHRVLVSYLLIYELAKKLDPYVERKMIPCIKFGRAPVERLQMKECVLCVYCDGRQRDEVWEILKEHRVELRAWAYERETMEKWSPGGYLLERWISSHGLDEEEAEKVRDGSRARFEKMFKDENAVFRGVEQ